MKVMMMKMAAIMRMMTMISNMPPQASPPKQPMLSPFPTGSTGSLKKRVIKIRSMSGDYHDDCNDDD